jgi:(E)-4-hydroxy-3-methylbut-2-enyl-diphosphate synthase
VLVADTADRDEDPLLFASVYLGSLLCDGLGDAVRVEGFGSPADSLRLAFNILQGTRLRLFKTEFISCPSCGRTQFDLEETTRRIKSRTAHLKGVKIAIMGCIVNGPGEMADADFGYVGWGPGKVSLFVGKDLVEKDIPYAEADERLVLLIQKHGRWNEPVSLPTPAPIPAGGTRE